MPAAAFIVPAVASVVGSIIQGHAASSAASQQKDAGQAAAQTFQPFTQGGVAAFNKNLDTYGIAPVAVPGGVVPAGQRGAGSPIVGTAVPRPTAGMAMAPAVSAPMPTGQTLDQYGRVTVPTPALDLTRSSYR